MANRSSAQLPDGSELHLNTDSAVTVRYTRSERVVEIARGQALFTVARDDHRRFRVAAGDAHAIAVGTEFDIHRRPDTTTRDGRRGKRRRARWTGRRCRVRPDCRLVHCASMRDTRCTLTQRGVLAQPTPVDLQQTVAWLQRQIAFEQRPLGEVAEEFNRYGSIPIEIDDAALRAPADQWRVRRVRRRLVRGVSADTRWSSRGKDHCANSCLQREVTEGMKRLRSLTKPSRLKNANDSGAQPARDLRHFGFPRVLTRRGIRKYSRMDIAAQPLAQALSEFATQTGLQLVYVSGIAATDKTRKARHVAMAAF